MATAQRVDEDLEGYIRGRARAEYGIKAMPYIELLVQFALHRTADYLRVK